MTEGRHTYLVARVSSATIDALAAFEAEGEDREPYMDEEPALGSSSGGFLEMIEVERDTADDEPDHDNEPSIC